MNLDETAEQRFWDHTKKGGSSECWEWIGSRNARGYGRLLVSNRPELAHRVSFLLAFGWLPTCTMHKCDNPPCVNPSHLFGGTHADNAADMSRKGRAPRRGPTLAVRSTILALRELGMTCYQIGHQVGLSHATVARELKRADPISEWQPL